MLRAHANLLGTAPHVGLGNREALSSNKVEGSVEANGVIEAVEPAGGHSVHRP